MFLIIYVLTMELILKIWNFRKYLSVIEYYTTRLLKYEFFI